MSTRPLQACIDSIPYAVWLGLKAQPREASDAEGTHRFSIVGDGRHLGNPILNVWHGGALAASLQCAMMASLMHAHDLAEPPQLYEHTTRYIGNSSIEKPLTLVVRILKVGRRVGFVEAAAQPTPGNTIVSAQASFRGTG